MVKSGYYGHEDLNLVPDCIKVRQMNPFITTITSVEFMVFF